VTRLLATLEKSADSDLLCAALWGQSLVQRVTGAAPEAVEATCTLLEQAAREGGIWAALARGLRAITRLDAGDVGAALGQLAQVDLDQLAGDLSQPGGAALIDVLATAYSRLRLDDQVDDVRGRAEGFLAGRPALERAVHWAHFATELAVRAMEPCVSGSPAPDQNLLIRATEMATKLSTVPPDLVPDRLRRGADGVRALAAAYRDRPAEALRLLGEDAFDQPEDLPWPERQLTTLAAIHAHLANGGKAIARSLDDGAPPPPSPTLAQLMLEVCRARERLALESRDGGDAAETATRVNQLLGQLAEQSLALAAGASRQALEHQTLRTESRTDALTGVGNRRAFDEDLRTMLRFSRLPQSLVLVDIDDFTGVNDRFTPVIGDEVLRRVAVVLGQHVRPGDRLTRYGGGTFVLLLPLTSDAEAQAIATAAAQAVAAVPWAAVAEGLTLAVTSGVATVWALSHRRPDGDATQLFRQADEQLRQAKRQREPGPSTPAAPPAPAPPAAAGESRPAPRPRLLDPLRDPLPAEPGVGPLSPAFGLPLYRAVLQNPPRVDPYLGTLPPADPADPQLTPLNHPSPANGSPATGSPAIANGTATANGTHNANGARRANGALDTNGARRGPNGTPAPGRTRRRPPIIDLTRSDRPPAPD
jgi:diguanylate cyclase (GGDEF)-like protein